MYSIKKLPTSHMAGCYMAYSEGKSKSCPFLCIYLLSLKTLAATPPTLAGRDLRRSGPLDEPNLLLSEVLDRPGEENLLFLDFKRGKSAGGNLLNYQFTQSSSKGLKFPGNWVKSKV